MTLKAGVVSRKLRKKGFVVLYSGHSRMREGIRLRQSGDKVFASVDIDTGDTVAIADDLMETLALLGYGVERTGDELVMWVYKIEGEEHEG